MPDRFSVLKSEISVLEGTNHAYELCREHLIKDGSPSTYVTVNNVHNVTEGYWRPAFRSITNGSFLSLPDGMPLVRLAHLLGYSRVARVTGPDFMLKALELSQKDHLSHYFFGATPKTIAKLQSVVELSFPNAVIKGAVSPSFEHFGDEEKCRYIEGIAQSKADFVWICLGSPKQEQWIAENYRKIDKGIFIGVGAAFQYVVGDLKRAPAWIQALSLEWFYRLLQEPRRLFGRYFRTNLVFVVLVLKDLMIAGSRKLFRGFKG